jgi:predicted DNA-binding mobile mystery protein A
MSAGVLARRLGTTASAVMRLEQSEASDRIQLGTLRRAADALGCEVVYFLVPRRPLEETVREQARKLAAPHAAAVEHTMALEDQATGRVGGLEDELVQHLLTRGGLWRDE